MSDVVSVVLVRPLVGALGEEDPAAAEALLRAARIDRETLADRDALLSPVQLAAAWVEAQRLSGDPTLALTLAERAAAGSFGLVEYVCRASPTVGRALAQWVRYLGLLDASVEVGLVAEGEHVALRVVRESEAPAPAAHELCFALVARRAAEMAGPRFGVTAVRFTHRLASRAPYERFFGAPVEDGASATELVLDAALLDVSLSTADPNLLELLLPQAEAGLDARRAARPTADRVRRALRASLAGGGEPLERVAAQLGMSARSLQRRLRDEGTSYQEVLDRTRHELALGYLARDLALAEVAFLLGFSAPSAFVRAFKRWTGRTPADHRRA